MRLSRLVTRALRYRLRSVLAVTAASVLTCAVLTGALMARDSVKASLDLIVERRLGKTTFAAETGDRFFTRSLASSVEARSGAHAAAILGTGGSISVPGDDKTSRVAVYGVDTRFWQLGPAGGGQNPGRGEVFINTRLAEELGLEAGDTIVIRAGYLDAFPGDAPLAGGPVETAAIRANIVGILAPDEFGDFSLRSDQVPPLNVFIGYDEFAFIMDLDGKANIFLSAAHENLAKSVENAWTIEDAGLEMVEGKIGTRLVSDRVFVDEEVVQAARIVGGEAIMVYFVDAISSGGRSIPYSFIAGLNDDRIPKNLEPDEIMLTRWAAEDLGVSPGDHVSVQYRMSEIDGILVSHTRSFSVRGVIEHRESDDELMPRFPGFEDADNCRDWDPGAPIDFSLIRDRDEIYWDLYGGSPKAYLSLESARELWTNRYGSATTILFSEADVRERLHDQIGDPGMHGFALRPVREDGLRSSAGGTDFGQLFLGLSMFLLAAAIILTALLYSLTAESRRREIAILSSLGYARKIILTIVLAEGAVIAAIGGIGGATVGILYNRLVIWGLRTIWSDAVRFSGLVQSIKPRTLLYGFLAGWAASFAALAWTSRGIAATSPREALLESHAIDSSRRPRLAWALAGSSIVTLLGLLTAMWIGILEGRATVYLLSGALLLIALLSCFVLALRHVGSPVRRLTIPGLAIKNAARRRNRTTAVAALMAAGVFVTTAVGANRTTVDMLSEDEKSGTGGFDMVLTSAVPLEPNLGRGEAIGSYRIEFPSETTVVGFRVRPGDDASCLNLNRVERPRLLGVDPAALQGTFSAAEYAKDYQGTESPWSVLDMPRTDGLVPAVADATVVTWGLGKSVGDVIEYVNESGKKVGVLLAVGLKNSIFQGNLIISKESFRNHFPSISGEEFFLVDTPSEDETLLDTALSTRLADFGVEIELARDRLAGFYSVQNTYLAIFMSLGWIGLLLGTAGLGIAVFKNVHDSRSEFAALSALGYPDRTIRRIARITHLAPTGVGIVAGAASAALTAGPAAGGLGLSWLSLAGLTGLLAAFATIWILAAVRFALPRSATQSLRKE